MTRVIRSFAEISDRYRAAFVDLWGCVHDGREPFPEAEEALRRFRRSGSKVVLVTNSPRPRLAVERQLGRIGVDPACWDAIATSGDSARAAMFRGVVGARVHHLGPPRERAFFDEMSIVDDPVEIALVPLDEAEGIVCTGLVDDETESPDDYRETLLHAKRRNLKLLCANPDIVVDRGERRVWCAGALAEMYARMGGESLYFGKPWPPIYDLARRRLRLLDGSIADAEVVAIGDGIQTDVQGAADQGLDAVFITGGLAAEETGTTNQPDPAALEAFLNGVPVSPEYAIGKLR